MKKFLKTPEEVISALKEGRTVHSNCGKFKMIDGIIVFNTGDFNSINAELSLDAAPYIEESELFKIEVGKFYETRDGKKARCYLIQEQAFYYSVDDYGVFSTDRLGRVNNIIKDDNDIIGPWED